MHLVSKFEAIGIFASVAIMAVALAMIRFQSDIFLRTNDTSGAQTGSVVAAEQRGGQTIEDKITGSVALDGTVTKLVIDDVRIGTGREVVRGDTVSVHYIGTLRDGSQFDNSYLRNEPFSFTVGEGQVIQGWEEGLIGMKEGGRRIIVVPPDMAYGNRQVGPIPANSALIFSLELVEIQS